MKVVIPGGSGQVGRVLARAHAARGHEVVLLGRDPRGGPWRTVAWDGRSEGPWWREIDGADVVVNLAGRNVNCRYSAANRRAILASRVDSTRAVGTAIAAARRPPALWLQASTATIYAHRFDACNDEATGILDVGEGAPPSWRFSLDVALAWEAALHELPLPATRRVAMRSAMTMSPDRGGIFDTLLWLVRCGLGGRAGNGRQWISWIHERDFVRAVDWIVEHPELDGAVNIASPEPLPNDAFMRALRDAWGTRIGLPATTSMLQVGARLLRTETELVCKSRRVVPARLLEGGFRFELPRWADAARELCDAWRSRRR